MHAGSTRATLTRQRMSLLQWAMEGRVRIHCVLCSNQPPSDGQWKRLLKLVANTPVIRTMREGAEITSEHGT